MTTSRLLENGYTPLDTQRLANAKRSYVTRRVQIGDARQLVSNGISPAAGDLLLARIDKIGQHARLESPDGRRQHLFPGDEVILCYGNRYASAQFEAIVPDDLEPCALVAAGGIAAKSLSRHSAIKRATDITPLGLIANADGEVLNLQNYALEIGIPLVNQPLTIAVFGASMDAGKTTTVANLIRGMRKQGLKIGVAKITGTGSGPDAWKCIDAGADVFVDFTDAGLASTYREPIASIENCGRTLLRHLTRQQVDVIILEVADGLLQPETAAVLQSAYFHKYIDGVIYAASDSMNAEFGLSLLQQSEWPVLCVSGLIMAAPLQCAEFTARSPIPLLGEETLTNSDIYSRLNFWLDNYSTLRSRVSFDEDSTANLGGTAQNAD